jgi:uncharacterized protein (TIRG00374 family)
MSYPERNESFRKSWFIRLGKTLGLLLPIPLLWWTFRQFPLGQVSIILRKIEFSQLLLWLGFNAVLLVLMNGRWWLILRVFGFRVSFPALTRYRLAAFSISYFTPGPQFGGEPLQVLALYKRHQVPAMTATASVSLDRLLDLIANFSFLVFGATLALSGSWFPAEWRSAGLTFSFGLLAFPLVYLILMLAGQKPLIGLTARLPRTLASTRLVRAIHETEKQMSYFCVDEPRMVLAASMISLAVWIGMVMEYWLLTRIVGLDLSFIQAISALVAARLALLTPLPGGLGAMEASQLLAFQTLGIDPAYGGTIALLIRGRDLIFGCFGLISVVSLLNWRPWFLLRRSIWISSKKSKGV